MLRVKLITDISVTGAYGSRREVQLEVDAAKALLLACKGDDGKMRSISSEFKVGSKVNTKDKEGKSYKFTLTKEWKDAHYAAEQSIQVAGINVYALIRAVAKASAGPDAKEGSEAKLGQSKIKVQLVTKVSMYGDKETKEVELEFAAAQALLLAYKGDATMKQIASKFKVGDKLDVTDDDYDKYVFTLTQDWKDACDVIISAPNIVQFLNQTALEKAIAEVKPDSKKGLPISRSPS